MRHFLILLLLLLPLAAHAAESDADDSKASGLPLPRFASLRVGEVNLRTGPGTRYPIDWVLIRQSMPVEITAEFDVWRRIRDPEGAEGWVQKLALTGKRTVIVTGQNRDMYRYETPKSPVLAHLEPGAIGELLACEAVWCKVKFARTKGYLRKTDFWGAYPTEIFN